MTYFIAFKFDFQGLNNVAYLFKLDNNNNLETVKGILTFKENPYGNIYFIYIEPEYLRMRSVFVRTNLKPLFEIKGYFNIYCIKILYVKEYIHDLPNDYTYTYIKNYVNNCLQDTINEYTSKYNKNEVEYIVAITNQHRIYKNKFELNIRVYIVEQLNKDEVNKIMEDNETLLLWELV
jgi:hypothetical protein